MTISGSGSSTTFHVPQVQTTSAITQPNLAGGYVTTGTTGISTNGLGGPSTWTDQFTSTDATWSLGSTVATLRSLLGSEVANFAILPSLLCVGFGADRYALTDLVRLLPTVRYIEFGNEIAVRRVVYDAIIAFSKADGAFAGLSIVEFLNQVLTQEPADKPQQLETPDESK